jgi:YesN/AraC family two-component response regulator
MELPHTALTSSEIAYQIGYRNPRYFYRSFKVVGCRRTSSGGGHRC